MFRVHTAVRRSPMAEPGYVNHIVQAWKDNQCLHRARLDPCKALFQTQEW